MTSAAQSDRVLAGRYRIDGRIGRGGMGEVFRVGAEGGGVRADRKCGVR